MERNSLLVGVSLTAALFLGACSPSSGSDAEQTQSSDECIGGASVCSSNEERAEVAASPDEAFLWEARSGYRAEVLQDVPDQALLNHKDTCVAIQQTEASQVGSDFQYDVPRWLFQDAMQQLRADGLTGEQYGALSDVYILAVEHFCPEYLLEGY
jgi:hypothetical protein